MATLSRSQVAERLDVSSNVLKRHGIGLMTESEFDRLVEAPPDWLVRLRARRRRRSNVERVTVPCCVCGVTRHVRPSLVRDYTHLVCGPCDKRGARPPVTKRRGMVLVHSFDVAGFFHGYTHRVATIEERASVERAAELARWATERSRS